MNLPQDLREFVELLNARGVKYVIVGGYALAHHGHPRFTGDIDLFIEATAENAQRIIIALDEFGFSSLGLNVGDFTTPDLVVQLGYPPHRIDLLNQIDGVTFNEAWASRSPGILDGLTVNFISRDHLIRNKRASGRPKDLTDLDQL